MDKSITGTQTRQSVPSLGLPRSQRAPSGVARRGQTARKRDQWPRPVTRGHLLQDSGEVSPSPSVNGIIDWYQFTLPSDEYDKPSALAVDISGWLPAFTGFLERGMMGYTQGLILPGEGKVLWNDDRPDMGVHVILPSKALKFMEVDAMQLAGWVHLRGGHCTRVDVALDTDQVHMSQVIEAQNAGNLVSRAQDRQLIYNYRDGSQTLYVGSRKSRRFVRFYDKALEQQSKTGEVHSGVWTRCEVEFKREQAQMVSEYIALGAGLRDLIYSCVDFRDSSQEKNINRCDRLSWWAAWVGEAEKLSFAVGNVVADVVGQAYTWVQKQVAPTLAFLDRALGVAALDALIDAARGRIPEYRLRVLAAIGSG